MTLNALPGWATNTNYSTGPDSGTPTKVDPASAANGFISGVTAAPQHVNYLIATLAAELLKAVDGENGGTYTLAGDLEFTGAGAFILNLQSQIPSGAALTVEDGGALTIDDGGAIDVAAPGSGSGGAINVDGKLNLNASGILAADTGALITLASGVLLRVDSGGDIRLARAADLKIASETCFWRGNMIAQWISLGTVSGDFGPVWADNEEIGNWDLNNVAAEYMIRFWLNRLPGDVVTSISVSLNGGAGAGHGSDLPTSMPKIQLVKITSGGDVGGKTIVASTVDASASAAAYDVDHVVTLDSGTDTVGGMPFTVTGDPIYLEVLGEHGTHAVATTLRLNSVFGQSTSKAYRSNFEFA